ncbi:tripartite tricarboxylate transporter TctB family protein [Terasakiella sp. A23]|uniref:tripartite tricarboxylate transporter TctB family protein n=1 Tax=Terasakiella sp. FCG-A23 TaxID=3080561 RepID=UPI002954E2BA|nr:tripartite tricarboxylate transporter TctB family protein [Terasakiella sp. A23]MDV7340221.1 tripartite tricarboxylate transporter TctB family protein [Terasakiella sp. A23]
MALDKWIAVFFLAFSLAYGYASYTYPLLPFERNMAFLPNTLPTALSVIGIVISLILLLGKKSDEEEGASSDIDLNKLKEYKIGQACSILAAMVVYALLLRPLGFIPTTIFFLVGCGWILGERKLHIMISVAAVGTIGIWYLVQEVLGIFLKPLPWFIS